MTINFEPIDTYPHCGCDGGWGPQALVRVEWDHGIFECVAWLEAGMWLYRIPNDPLACGEMQKAPISWCDIGHAFRDEAGELRRPYPCPNGEIKAS